MRKKWKQLTSCLSCTKKCEWNVVLEERNTWVFVLCLYDFSCGRLRGFFGCLQGALESSIFFQFSLHFIKLFTCFDLHAKFGELGNMFRIFMPVFSPGSRPGLVPELLFCRWGSVPNKPSQSLRFWTRQQLLPVSGQQDSQMSLCVHTWNSH